jgi:hypothetical protein
VTTGGGVLARESADGRWLYYTSSDMMLDSPLQVRPVNGGAPTTAVPCVRRQAFVVHQDGIYYAGCETPMDAARLHLLDTRTGQDRVLGTLTDYSGNFPWSLAVSPLDRTILYGRVVHVGADLMMIEHFR